MLEINKDVFCLYLTFKSYWYLVTLFIHSIYISFYFISSSIQFHKVSLNPNVGQRQYYWFQEFSGKFLRIRASKLLVATAESRFCLSFEVYRCRPGILGKSSLTFEVMGVVENDLQKSPTS